MPDDILPPIKNLSAGSLENLGPTLIIRVLIGPVDDGVGPRERSLGRGRRCKQGGRDDRQ